jgi:hypothetical protein
MSSYQVKRRNFLWGLGAAAAGIGGWLSMAESAAQGISPKRYMRMHRGVGTIYRNWFLATPPVVETDWQATRILSKFEGVRSHMAVLEGMDIQKGAGGHHESYSVVLATGMDTKTLWPGNGGDDPKPEGPSFDYELIRTTPHMVGAIPSLQLAVDDRVEGNEYSCRRLSYSGANDSGAVPTTSPSAVYNQLRGQVAAADLTPEQWEKMRLEKVSVLDFVRSDLERLKVLAPAAERARVYAHADALRALETSYAVAPVSGACFGDIGEPPANLMGIEQSEFDGRTTTAAGDDLRSEQVGKAHLDMVRAAFQCDMTRVVNFLWSPGTSTVGFSGFGGDPNAVRAHHDVSHTDGTNDNGIEFLTKVEEFYAERTAQFVQQLINTEDAADPMGGSLMDNTFLMYTSEEGEGPDHNPVNLPLLVFGGTGVGLRGGIYKRFGGWTGNGKPNNLYMTAIKALGANMETFGDPAWCESGPLDILTT